MKARHASFLLRALAGCLPLAVAAFAGAAGAPQPLVVVGRIETPIHPAAASYLEKLIKGAEEDHAAIVVLGLSTPGGLLTSTRVMASTILASKVPVVTYVSPSGASAASAGFFLLLAGDVAAMAPGTNTRAAHPVAGEGQEPPAQWTAGFTEGYLAAWPAAVLRVLDTRGVEFSKHLHRVLNVCNDADALTRLLGRAVTVTGEADLVTGELSLRSRVGS